MGAASQEAVEPSSGVDRRHAWRKRARQMPFGGRSVEDVAVVEEANREAANDRGRSGVVGDFAKRRLPISGEVGFVKQLDRAVELTHLSRHLVGRGGVEIAGG